MNLALWLTAIVGPLAWRVVAALGFGIIVFQGVDTAVAAGLNSARTYWGQFGGTAADLVALSGINTAFGIVAGGVSARLALLVLKRMVVK